jgi:hypothetical protein
MTVGIRIGIGSKKDIHENVPWSCLQQALGN